MNIDSFFRHHGLECNPFDAEEARLDPIFDRLQGQRLTHPDFGKIMGSPDRPSTAIVFGEKGSGKTAIRQQMTDILREHNLAHADRRVLVVEYDDLNPVFDRVLRRRRQQPDALLKSFRLEDHQDAILSRGVTKLVDALLGETSPGDVPPPLPDQLNKIIKKLSRQNRADLAVLAALYDQPITGSEVDRFHRLRSKLRLGWRMPLVAIRHLATALALIAVGFIAAFAIIAEAERPWWLVVAMGISVAVAILAWGYWAMRHLSLWRLVRQIHSDTPTIDHSVGELREMLGELSPRELARQPFPLPSRDANSLAGDARYQLTRRFVDLLAPFGYRSMLVLVDRMDEPTIISGNPDKMRTIVWPMFDNKFLQQERVGFKLLLPAELRHLLHKESAEFFHQARLDKTNTIERLTWSGATLYDLCNMRLRACMGKSPGSRVPSPESGAGNGQAATADLGPGTRDLGQARSLTDLFAEDVTREQLVDALDQMHQPRDAFKFLYQVIQDHCRLVPEEQADFRIARLTLESVRRQQSQRVQELYRGLAPA